MTNTINDVELQKLQKISTNVANLRIPQGYNDALTKPYDDRLLVPWVGETGTPNILKGSQDATQLQRSTYSFFVSYYDLYLKYLYFYATGDTAKTKELAPELFEKYSKNIPNVKLDSNFCYYAFCNVFRDIMKQSVDTYFLKPFGVDRTAILALYNQYGLAAFGCPFEYFEILIVLGKYSRFFFMSNADLVNLYAGKSDTQPKLLYYMSLLDTQRKELKQFIQDMTSIGQYYTDNLINIVTSKPELIQFYYFVIFIFEFINNFFIPDLEQAKQLDAKSLSDKDKKVLTSYTLLFDINYFKTLLNQRGNKLFSQVSTSQAIGSPVAGSVADITTLQQRIEQSEPSLGFGRGPLHAMSLLSRASDGFDRFDRLSERTRSSAFRSPENTISKTESRYILKKPLIYLGGSLGSSVTWRNRLIERLREFYFYNPNVLEMTHGRLREYPLDSFYDDIAIQCADVLLFYIDYDNRCVDVISQVVFYMEIGYPMVLIVQNIPEYKFPESRHQLNLLRELVVKKANEKNIRVYRTFRDFERDNIVDGVISSEKLLSNVGDIRSTLDATSQANNMQSTMKRLSVKSPEINSVLFSKKPIVEQVQIDVGGEIVTKDKSYSLSVSSAVHVTEYYAIILFYLFNRLGFDNFDLGFSERDVVKIENDFRKIKTELIVEPLDTSFYDQAQLYVADIKKYLDTGKADQYNIEIQFTIHILVQLLKKNFKISFMREKDYLEELIKNNIYHSFFNAYLKTDINWSTATPESIVAQFAIIYVLPFIQEMNSARSYLLKFISLYPEILQSNTLKALEHLSLYYGFSLDKKTGTFEFLGNTVNVGKRPNILVFYRILQFYYNNNQYIRNPRSSYKRIITERQ